MSDVAITVTGSFQASYAPERATVHLVVTIEGRDKGPVQARASQVAAQVTDSIRPLADPGRGPVTWWSSDQLRTGAHRPFNKDGKQLPLVHRAVIPFHVKFSDFAVLGEWLADVAEREGISIERIEWALTERRRLRARDEARSAAVKDAVAKASAYAAALGMGSVQPVAIADPGMLGDHVNATSAGQPQAYARAGATPGAAVNLVPQDIDVVVEVDARFVASS